jgi:UDP-N-acetylmuramate dehydrogenase
MKIEKNKNLKEFTTFRIGGPAQFFCSVTNEAELEEAIAFAKTNKLAVFILGGGSNILMSDEWS